MPGAKIVERQPDAELLDAREHLRGVLGIFHHQRFGDFQLEGAARQRRARQHAAQVLDQVVAQQLPRRHVDAGEDRLARAAGGLPDCELARGAFEHEQAEVGDQADFLGGGDELGRRQAAKLGMIPARQRLETGNGAILQPHDRLVEHLDLLALDGAAQFRFHGQPVGLARAHGRLEDFDAVAADPLGVIHGELGVLEHFLGVARLVFGERQPDRGGDEDFAVVEADRRAQGAAHGLGEGHDARGLAFRQQDQGELVAG